MWEKWRSVKTCNSWSRDPHVVVRERRDGEVIWRWSDSDRLEALEIYVSEATERSARFFRDLERLKKAVRGNCCVIVCFGANSDFRSVLSFRKGTLLDWQPLYFTEIVLRAPLNSKVIILFPTLDKIIILPFQLMTW